MIDFSRSAFAIAMLASLSLPASAFAQADGSSASASRNSYHLMQLTVKTSDITADEFSAKTKSVRSCGDAVELAKELGADVTRNRFVPHWELPENLKAELEETATGHATKVFSNDPEIMRVLVICHRV